MKNTILLLLMALLAVPQMYSQTKIDDLYYNLDIETKTAEVTYYKNNNTNVSYVAATLVIPATVEYNSNVYTVTKIGDFAFRHCTYLDNVTIPETVISIGSQAFGYCENLQRISIPESVTTIGSYAFHACKKLADIQLPNSLLEIQDWTFYTCENIKSIKIPNSVKSIGRNAFYYCESLEKVEIGASVKEIEIYAFGNCNNLRYVYNYSVNPQIILSNVFYNQTIKAGTLYVPEESIELYKSADVWKDFYIIGIDVNSNLQSEDKDANFFYHDINGTEIHTHSVTLKLPIPEAISGYTFQKWVVLSGDLDEGIHVQAQYIENGVVTQVSDFTQDGTQVPLKVIRHGQIYIMRDDKVYDTSGKEVK